MINTSFICDIGLNSRINLSDSIDLLNHNGWPCILSNDLPWDPKNRYDIIRGSTWGLFFSSLSFGNPQAMLELGVLLASPECKLVALIGVMQPFLPLLAQKKVVCYSDWENFRARMFVP